jgi:predicted transcriptional regulator
MAASKENRGRHEIIALKEYLSILAENGLIEKLGNSNGYGIEKTSYKITEKGLRFLHISQEIESLMGIKW